MFCSRFHLLLAFLLWLPLTGFAQSDVLNNQDIIQLTLAKVSRSVITDKIQQSRHSFDVSPQALIELLQAKVSDRIIETMIQVTTRPQLSLTNQDIIALSDAGFTNRLIKLKIQSTPNQFDSSTQGLIQLKQARVPDEVVKAMMTAKMAQPAETGSARSTGSVDRKPPVDNVPIKVQPSSQTCKSVYDPEKDHYVYQSAPEGKKSQ